MTATKSLRLPSREAHLPWMLRRRTIFIANAACLVANAGAAVAEADWSSHFIDICATVDVPTNFGAIGMTAPVTIAVIGICVVAGLSIVLTIGWCIRSWPRRRPAWSVLGMTLLFIGFALLNVLLAYVFDLRSLSDHVTCSGGV